MKISNLHNLTSARVLAASMAVGMTMTVVVAVPVSATSTMAVPVSATSTMAVAVVTATMTVIVTGSSMLKNENIHMSIAARTS